MTIVFSYIQYFLIKNQQHFFFCWFFEVLSTGSSSENRLDWKLLALKVDLSGLTRFRKSLEILKNWYIVSAALKKSSLILLLFLADVSMKKAPFIDFMN